MAHSPRFLPPGWFPDPWVLPASWMRIGKGEYGQRAWRSAELTSLSPTWASGFHGLWMADTGGMLEGLRWGLLSLACGHLKSQWKFHSTLKCMQNAWHAQHWGLGSLCSLTMSPWVDAEASSSSTRDSSGLQHCSSIRCKEGRERPPY